MRRCGTVIDNVAATRTRLGNFMIRQSQGLRQAIVSSADGLLPALWVGEARCWPAPHGAAAEDEMTLALGWARERMRVVAVASSAAAAQAGPTDPPAVILLPLPWSGAVREPELVELSRQWPLAELVLITGTAVDGRRRRGPLLAGALAVPWYELPGRIGLWCRQRQDGVGESLWRPATCRREDRLLAGIAAASEWRQPGIQVSVAAGSRSLHDGLEMLAVAAGVRVISRHQGKPPLSAGGDVILWDVGDVGDAELAHIARLHEARPSLPLLLFEGFPRGATAAAVKQAGGAHVLGQPLEADVLAETLRWVCRPLRG